MVYIMAIHLAMGTRLVWIGVRGGHLRMIKTIFLLMRPTTPPTFIPSPMFNNVGQGTHIGFLFGPLVILWCSLRCLTM
jgi:hypothetical protein